MFATKKDAEAWLRDYGKKGFASKKRHGSKYWWILDQHGYVISEEEIHAIEDESK